MTDNEAKALIQRVAVLEKQVELLREEISTLKDMRVSEQMHNYIAGMERTQRFVSLIESVSDGGEGLDIEKENRALSDIKRQVSDIDARIDVAVQKAGTFSDDMGDTSKYFSYTEYKHGVEITSYNGFDSKTIIVPKAIDGRPVIRIGKETFKNSTLSSIFLPTTLEEIGESAFSGCSELTEIDLPETLTMLEKNCFYYSAIIKLIVPPKITKVPTNFCYACRKLKQIVFSDGIGEIDYGAFQSCESLNTIQLPNSLKIIGRSALQDSSIVDIVIPENVSDMGTSSLKSKHIRNVAFLGNDIKFPNGFNDYVFKSGLADSHPKERTIYCLPGSTAQKYARDHKIPMKPLSEFPRN